MQQRRRSVKVPDRRRLDPSTALPANAPAAVKDLDDRVEKLYTQPHRFAALVGRNLVGKHERLRSRRDDRRANWVKVTRALGRRFDQRTWRCGTPRGDRRDSVDSPGIDELAAECRIAPVTVKRVLAEMEDAELIDSYRVVMEYVDGNGFCGLPSVRRFTKKFLLLLGFTEKKLTKMQAHGAAVWRAKRAPAISPAAVRAARAARDLVGQGFQAAPASPLQRSSDPELAIERNLLRRAHPDWGPEQVDATARRNLSRPE